MRLHLVLSVSAERSASFCESMIHTIVITVQLGSVWLLYDCSETQALLRLQACSNSLWHTPC